jgi:dCMP deaminase
MKKKFIDYFMNIANLTSTLSYAKRLQVGAVIVKGNQIIGTGYNGMPTGWENNCEYEETILQSEFGRGTWVEKTGQLKTRPEVLHAESNAIAKVSRSTESSENATMFCTHAPCIECAKLIYQSGINTLYYRNQYRDDSGLEFLKQGGVNVHQYTDSTQD